MNILILNFGLYKGGTETQFHTVISTFKKLQKEKYRFVIASLKNNSTFDRRIQMIGVPWYENLMKYKGDIFTIPRLLSIIEKENVNAIYVTGSEGYIIPISVLTGIASKRPVIACMKIHLRNASTSGSHRCFIQLFSAFCLSAE